MRVAIYARVSTANNGQDPTMQTRELREYAERRGWTVAGEYVDIGISGTKERRAELDRLMVDAHRRRFDVVAVWKFDRMARSVSHLLRVLETFGALGIHFVSLSEAIDTATPRNAKAKGKRLGRPRVIVDAATIASLRAQGRSWPQIARELGVSVGTAYAAAHRLSKNVITSTPATP
jgi:DNA invertase Pin-like site-specific DNA recombinase